MEKTTLDKNIEFIGKKCFPLNEKSSKEFSIQIRRIAKKYGLKYREEEISRGLTGWIPRTIRPVIYRKILNPSQDGTDLSNYSIDDIVYFEDDHFFVRKGYEELRRDLRDLYETFSMVREAEEEVERNRRKLDKIEQEERKTRLVRTILETQEIIAILNQYSPLFTKNAEKESFLFGERQILCWRYLDCKGSEDYPVGDSLFKSLDEVLGLIKNKIIDKFEDKANLSEIREEFYEKWEREDRRIIIPIKYR